MTAAEYKLDFQVIKDTPSPPSQVSYSLQGVFYE